MIDEASPEGDAASSSPYRTPYRRAPTNPWWIAPFLGRVPDVPPAKVQLLGVVALAMLFESYDQAMLTAALKQIAETFSVAESALGDLLGWVHLGALPAFALVPLADRIGRRRLFLASLVGLSLATFLSAFAQDVEQLIALQMVSRAFMVTCAATAYVIITEELPAAHRGWGIGIVGAIAAGGYGLGLLLFAAIDVLPYGWRAMYLLGITPVLFLGRFRRRVLETRRFQEHRSAREHTGLVSGWLRPLWSLVRAYPSRSVAVGLIGLLASAAQTCGFSFAAYYVQSVHGWAPGQYTVMAVLAGAVGIIGHPWAGRVADRRGRRLVGFLLMASFPLLALGFYHGPGWLLAFFWIPFVFSMTGTSTIERVVATELFPTSYRGTASGWLQLTEALGRASGLFIVAWGTAHGASNVPMIDLVVFASAAAGVVLLLMPETGRLELEDISHEVSGTAG